MHFQIRGTDKDPDNIGSEKVVWKLSPLLRHRKSVTGVI